MHKLFKFSWKNCFGVRVSAFCKRKEGSLEMLSSFRSYDGNAHETSIKKNEFILDLRITGYSKAIQLFSVF